MDKDKLLGLLHIIIEAEVQELPPLDELRQFPKYIVVEETKRGLRIAITSEAIQFLKKHDPEAAKRFLEQVDEAKKSQRDEDALLGRDSGTVTAPEVPAVTQWKEAGSVGQILTLFPKNPTADDLIDLHQYVQKCPSVKLQKLLKDRSSTYRVPSA
jgi:hypothetical protein